MKSGKLEIDMDRPIQLCEIERDLERIFRDVATGASYVVISNGSARARIIPWTPPPDAVRHLLAFVKTLPNRHCGRHERGNLYD